MSSQEKQIKVTDKRMFTPEGDLREEYRFLAEKSTADAAAEPGPVPAAAEPVAAASAPTAPAQPPPDLTGMETTAAPPLELPGTPPGYGPSFYDLVQMMAEPIPLYLGDMDLPNGQVVENLEMARLHIDLLDVLREKTAGNLTAQEAAYLEDLLYRARVRYVQKTG
ncbi:MAG TPA: DUF1844 domain-containing protein [Thermoanaerobaculia bacterium]|nr:DUF1844 domain-containing protein [Thermoanaerobaculia bacterium]